MIKFDHRKLAKATNIHFVAQVKQYLRDAKIVLPKSSELNKIL